MLETLRKMTKGMLYFERTGDLVEGYHHWLRNNHVPGRLTLMMISPHFTDEETEVKQLSTFMQLEVKFGFEPEVRISLLRWVKLRLPPLTEE